MMNDRRLEETSVWVQQLKLSQVRLVQHQDYIWLMLIPQVESVRELIDLSTQQQIDLMTEIDQTSRILRNLFSPDKLNIATLGNVVPQLHVHVVCRYKNDKAWPGNIWNGEPSVPCEETLFAQRLSQIQHAYDVYNQQ